MGSQISDVGLGDLQVVEELRDTSGGEFFLGQSETMGHRRYVAKNLLSEGF